MGTPLIEQLAAAPAVGQDYRPYALTAAGDAVAFEWYRDGDWQIFIQSLPDGEPDPGRQPRRPLRLPPVLARRPVPVLHL